MTTPKLIGLLLIVLLTVGLQACVLHTSLNTADNRAALEEQSDKTAPASPLADIQVYFKLDPRLTRGLYMGDRWVSPPIYTRLGEGKELVVEARAHGLGPGGETMKVSPEWIPADPGMVAVSPPRGNLVKITVRRPGRSSLKITSAGISREVTIKASHKEDIMQVDIFQ